MINLQNLTGSQLLIGVIIFIVVVKLIIDNNFTMKNIIMSVLSISLIAFMIKNPIILEKIGEYMFKFILEILDMIEKLELIEEVKTGE